MRPSEEAQQCDAVVAALVSDDSAAIADRPKHPLYPPLPVARRPGGAEPPPSDPDRFVPGGGELPGTGAGAKRVGGLAAHSDHPGRPARTVAVAQEGDEIALTLGSPAIAAPAKRHRGEKGKGGRLHPKLMTGGGGCRTPTFFEGVGSPGGAIADCKSTRAAHDGAAI